MDQKVKIQRTARIQLNRGRTIYCAYQVIQDVRHLCVRLNNNVMVPARDQGKNLEHLLHTMCVARPELFATRAHDLLREQF